MGQAQRPIVQVWPPAHTVPQAPQLLLSVCELTQLPLQSVVPVAQPQAPIAHTRPVGQARPQAPQLAASVWVLTHTRPQSVEPVGQRQAPIWQVWPVGQAMPQAPQLALLVCVLTQVGAGAIGVQSVSPVMQVGRGATQRPIAQVLPAGQAIAHAPQLVGSVLVSAQAAPQRI